MPESRDFVLLATLGRTDIQVVLPLQGQPHRLSLAPGSTRAFHEACFQKQFPWELAAIGPPTLAIPEHRTIDLDYDAQTYTLWRLSGPQGPVVQHDCRLGVKLCAPILSGTVVAIQTLQQQGALRKALHVLLFNTRRVPPEPKEPSFAAAIVTPGLAKALQLAEDRVSECVFLEQGDVYEQDLWGERHLAYHAARRIDAALRELRMRYAEPPPLAVIADVGGIPETKSVLAESARYRFADVLFFRGTEQMPHGAVATPRRLISPAESLQTRRQVRTLLGVGAFEAAARLANSFVTEEQRRTEPWRAWLAAVAASFRGENPHDHLQISPKCVSETRKQLGMVLDAGPPLLAAFRVEAALQAGTWADALRATFTFYDASLLALLNQYLSVRTDHPCVDFQKHLLRTDCVSESVRRALGHQSQTRRWVYLTPEVVQGLGSKLPEEPRKTLKALKESLSPVRLFRNVATHGWLNGKQLRIVRDKLEHVGLWNTSQSPHFLGAQSVLAFFRLLGIERPDGLYRQLIEAIVADMDAYSFTLE